MTVPGVIHPTPLREPLKASRRGVLDGSVSEPQSHQMGLQVPHRVHTEGTQESAVWAVTQGSGIGISRTGAAQGKQDRRGDLWSVTSRGKELFTWPGCTASARGTLQGKVSGRRGILSRLSAGTRRSFATTSGTRRRRKTGAPWAVEISCHRRGGAKSWGRVSVPV